MVLHVWVCSVDGVLGLLGLIFIECCCTLQKGLFKSSVKEEIKEHQSPVQSGIIGKR